MTTDRKTGGCQCGAVRFVARGALDAVYVCHCRMCQKSVGGPFAVFTKLPAMAFRWTRGTPAEWASSSLGMRQFCGQCGTPLGYRYLAGPETADQYLTAGGFDDYRAVVPSVQMGVESKAEWVDTLPKLPVHDFGAGDPASIYATMTTYQHPDGEADGWTPRPRGE